MFQQPHKSLIAKWSNQILLLCYLIFFSPKLAQACPDIDGLVDMNCDGQVVIAAFGDSITYGIQDSRGLGYPGRLAERFPNTLVYNLGVPSENTYSGRTRAAQDIAAIPAPDYFLVLEGVNDYWYSGHSTSATRTNLLKIKAYGSLGGGLGILSRLTDVNRTFQRTWVYDVNEAIKQDSKINYYSLGKGILSSDNIHPDAEGYDEMADLAEAVMIEQGLLHRPSDIDGDGVYDFKEDLIGTNKYAVDSDGDTLTDSEELFTYHSNPLSLDSDADGLSDVYEVRTLGSNPADSRPGSPILQTIEVIKQ
ncbi:MAG: GDSL-type esterase/lipase family protein [bacterium]|nr:GDSL-type esterase/lipase family protein [bacterium]